LTLRKTERERFFSSFFAVIEKKAEMTELTFVKRLSAGIFVGINVLHLKEVFKKDFTHD